MSESSVRPRSPLSMLIYRQLLRPPGIQLQIDGQTYAMEPGDFVEGTLFMRFGQADLDRMGPTMKRQALETRFKTSIGGDQLIFRPGGQNAVCTESSEVSTKSVNQMPSVDASTVSVIRLPQLDPRKFLAGELAGIDPKNDVLLVDEDVLLPWGDLETAVMLAVSRRQTDTPFAFPAMNLADPVSLPMAGDHSSAMTRMPGGRSVWELATLLANSDLQPQAGWPARPGCVLTTHAVASKIAAGVHISTVGCSLVDPRVYAFRDADKAGPLASLLDSSGGFSATWPSLARAAHVAASGPIEGRPPVVFYSTTIGPWGGVAVLFRLADELQKLGVHAFVACQVEVAHGFRPRTAPLRIPTQQVLIEDWKRIAGEDAILVASHWGSGKLAKAVKAANPETIVTSILQDREDLFETTDKRPIPREDYQDYLDIGQGRSVSRWIIDSAAEDLGLSRPNYDVIPNGMDFETFKPGARPPDDGRPIRVLAMWRPQTDVRRGIALLRRTYEHLHATFGGLVSLELFGWNDPEGPGKAPAFAKHHGHLSHAQVAKMMGEVDIVVEPSLYQGFGLPGMEALACGAALVSTKCRGVDEYARHNENALVVDHDALPSAVQAVVMSPELRHRLQAAARPSLQGMGWDSIGARWALYLAGLYGERGGKWSVAWEAISAKAFERLTTGSIRF